MVRKPSRLTYGSTLGIVAPAGPVFDPAKIEAGIALLEMLGFRIILAPHALSRNKYLAGTDEERLHDFCRMIYDPDIDGILCLRGGYGSTRLLPGIDYGLVARNPKAIIGYSDITALQLAVWQKTGLVTFAGPMLASDFACGADNYTVKQFIRALTWSLPLGLIPAAPDCKIVTIYPGKARGRLLGGNLSMLTSLLGTPYEIDTTGTILLLEEINEPPYRVDRMLNQLLQAGKLGRAAGIVVGECVNCEPNDENRSFTLLEVLHSNLADLNIPCFYGFPAGHGTPKATLPLGVAAIMDAVKGSLAIVEAATTG